jgi:hypothetical protein
MPWLLPFRRREVAALYTRLLPHHALLFKLSDMAGQNLSVAETRARWAGQYMLRPSALGSWIGAFASMTFLRDRVATD